jgi:hypothetical protein
MDQIYLFCQMYGLCNWRHLGIFVESYSYADIAILYLLYRITANTHENKF